MDHVGPALERRAMVAGQIALCAQDDRVDAVGDMQLAAGLPDAPPDLELGARQVMDHADDQHGGLIEVMPVGAPSLTTVACAVRAAWVTRPSYAQR